VEPEQVASCAGVVLLGMTVGGFWLGLWHVLQNERDTIFGQKI